ncbi:MAG: acyltransferase, partial [Actinomycetota bacterium]|nr:acyltransferase [Actinomycetota bacterium]
STTVSLLTVAGALTLLAAGHRRPSGVLGAAPLVGLGDLSYSWYLWHWPVIVLTGVLFPDTPIASLVAAVASLLPAWVAARAVENPLRRSFPRRGRAVALLTVTCVAVPLSASALLGTAASAGWWQPGLAELVRSSRTTTLGRALDCLATGTVPARAPARCTRLVPGARGTVMLVGDSHADSLSDGVVSAGNRLGYDVALRAGRACPLTAISRFTTSQIPRCPDYVDQVLKEIDRVRPALVVIAHSSWEYEQELRGRTDPDPDATWARALLATVERIRASGASVLLVQDVPRLGLRPQPCRFGAVRPVECSVTRAAVAERQGAVASAERRALAGLHGVLTADPASVLCGPRACDAIFGDRLLYADNQHLNTFGSLRLAPALKDWMGAALRLSRT